MRDDVVMATSNDEGGQHEGTDGGRTIHVEIRFTVVEPAHFAFAVAPASSAGTLGTENFSVMGPEGPIPVQELQAPHGGRLHLHAAAAGALNVTYDAHFEPAVAPARPAVDPFEVLLYGRPSRYCPSDHLGGFAVAEFGTSGPARERTAAVVDWISTRVGYLAGSSTVHDSAEDTLLTGVGTCRDFAHLGVALCRAIDIPARFTSVYAPGLSPMDFHAVFEIFDEDRWWLFDATHRAPRSAMSRIATGRDAADTAFATVLLGVSDLEELDVLSTVDGTLPDEDRAALVELA
jgi:transglutaminase-like putative cysteine protease